MADTPTYKSTLTGPELDEALRNIGNVQANIEKAAGYAETAEQYGTIVEQNQTAIQAIEDNLPAVQGAAQNAADAKNAASSAAASASAASQSASDAEDAAQRAAGYAETAEQYGTIVEQNQTAIQAIEDNLPAVQGAAQNATDAKNAATSAAASASAASQSASDAEDAAKRAEAAAGVNPEDYFTKPQTKSIVSWQYSAIYDLDNWAASGSTDQANGYPWSQTVTLTPLNPQAPAITADSVFEPQIGCTPTGIAKTDNVLRAALAVIAGGNSTPGSGTITTIVKTKPEIDIPVIFTLKTEVV